jgi:hypothetical protein
MQNENDQPSRECEQSAGDSNEHQPTQYPEGIKEVAIILSVDNAGMHRALVYFATVRVGDPRACHHRSYGRKRKENDERQNDPVKDPRKTLSNGYGWRIHMAGSDFQVGVLTTMLPVFNNICVNTFRTSHGGVTTTLIERSIGP